MIVTGPRDESHRRGKLGLTGPTTSAAAVSISSMTEAEWAEMSSFVG
jgi:hypothetical protein